MSKLLEKHKFNFDSAAYLIQESHYAPSVHCSYYSCFQLIKHKVRALKNCTYDDLENNMKGESSHTYLINQAKNYLNPKNNKKIKDATIASLFKDNIKDLKAFRVTSDYENVEITHVQADKSYNLAREICDVLKKM